MKNLGVGRRLGLAADLSPRFPPTPYVPHIPHPPQQAFLLFNGVPEVFYGGAAGGGKSDAGLMAALQYVDVPGYSALIVRRTFQDLSLPGAIMARAEEWLSGRPGAHKKDGGKLWEFDTAVPSKPATIQFGYAQTHADVYRYQGAEFQLIFVDELTHFEERTYRYLFSRIRGPAVPCANCGHGTSQPAGELRQHDEDHDHCACGHEHDPRYTCDAPAADGRGPQGDGICWCSTYTPVGCECVSPEPDREARDGNGEPLLAPGFDGTTLAEVPLRMRSGSNPGGVGHLWVRARFIDAATKAPRAKFVPAKLRDNPSLDRKAYRAQLGLLTEVERRRLEEGDWQVADEGTVFSREWFTYVDMDEVPIGARWCRYWDFAATVQKPGKRDDPDWTVGALVGLLDGQWFIADIRRIRGTPKMTDELVQRTAGEDGRGVMVRMEQEPGASGVKSVDQFRRVLLPGFDADGIRPSLSKEERAKPWAKAAEVGNVFIVSAPWNRDFIDEVAAFDGDPKKHDDQIDAVSGAVDSLSLQRRARLLA